jgi:AcrR family transcriptional regulator
MRSDTRRNRRRLIAAAGEVIRSEGRDASMQTIAAHAEIGLATAYRYFSSVDALMAAYVLDIVEDLARFTSESPSAGAELFEEALAHWVRLVVVHGAVMVELRSTHGLFERLRDGDEIMTTVRSAWSRPIAELLESEHLPPDAAGPALFLLNILADPREILDLHHVVKLSQAGVIASIRTAFGGALTGWGSAMSRSARTALRRTFVVSTDR